MANEEQGAIAAVGVRDDVMGQAREWWRDVQEDEQRRHLPFTVLGVVAILLLGAIVVPLSIPDPLPQAPREQVLAERFLVAFAAPDAPTTAVKATSPTLDEVITTYGADGGVACTGSMAEAYDTFVTPGTAGRVSFDKAGFAQMKVAHSVYCPERSAGFGKFVQRRAALNRAARERAAAAGAIS